MTVAIGPRSLQGGVGFSNCGFSQSLPFLEAATVQIEQTRWTAAGGWKPGLPGSLVPAPQLVLVFAAGTTLKDPELLRVIRDAYPEAHLLGCSTAGEIFDTRVTDNALIATAVHFEHTHVAGARTRIYSAEESYEAGRLLARSLPGENLVHALVLSEGLRINGSDLVRGLTEELPADVTVTGGLSADGPRFHETLVLWDEAVESDSVAVLGFYGSRLRVGYASLGGWDPFGPIRLITRSERNLLFELDGQSALQLYRAYLGEHARELPASALRFPLSLQTSASEAPVVRTVLGIDEQRGCMIFAGDVPTGAYTRFMKANFDRLIDGAAGAAQNCLTSSGEPPQLALLISCVGRRLVLGQRVEEELESVREVLGPQPVLAGFYSYGEISPFTPTARCELHNQTMTITAFSEH